MARPGVMFYFDIRPCIKRLSLEEKGQLFEAILDYGEYGAIPEVDGVLGIAWDFIQPKLDLDAERYDTKVEQKRYATFVREVKKRGETPMPFDEWKQLSDAERGQVISADIGRYPTTTSNSNSNSNSDSNNNKADKPPRTRFSPPTVEEVHAYCKEKGYAVDPQRFVDYYTSNGWKVGKNPMKDWRAAVRNWSGKQEGDQRNGKAKSEPLWTIGTTV